MAEENDNPRGGGGGNVFTRKLGPLPMWAWMGVGLGGALAFTSWQGNKKKAAEAAAAARNGGSPAVPSPSTSALGLSGLIPQFVNQNYENPGPPVSNAPSGPKLPQVDPGATGVIGNRWDTILPNEKYLSQFITRVYGTPSSDAANMAINDSYVRMANPQINFNRPLEPGTAIFAPGIPK